MLCYPFLPSKERKTLGSGCGRPRTPVEKRERDRSADANSRGAPPAADPSGLPMAARTPDRHPITSQQVGFRRFLRFLRFLSFDRLNSDTRTSCPTASLAEHRHARQD
ncbi:hypothetical protein EYF80_020957 [Liparis tanakae]|uniref:Uncharacterized protein n=1 Tax=Liparis tanakae TaxID=230148 RepID=A0A4Z2HSF0_9TELE|nr:hypothetical protein EYF80_020957 [Liparis tanakae]